MHCKTCKVTACNAHRQGEAGCVYIPPDLRTSAFEFECPKCANAKNLPIDVSSRDQLLRDLTN